MKISVALCTYNGARYLRDQLESIAAQTQMPYELIILDDGSSDETVMIVESFAAGAAFPVHLHINNSKLGSTKSFEQAIGLCTGEIIALCDQDDVWLPTKLARFDAEFTRAPGVGLVFTDAEVVDEDLKSTGYSLWQKLDFQRPERQRLRRGRGFDALLQGATVTGATAAFRSRFKPLTLPIPDDLPLIHDAWMAVLIAAVSDILPLPERLIKYRQHAGQQIGAQARNNPQRAQRFIAASARQALRRENPYAEMLATAQAVHGRLSDRLTEFDSREVLGGLEAKITHLTARSELPDGKIQRASPVFRELLSGRYHRYSNGFRSAVKDLLA